MGVILLGSRSSGLDISSATGRLPLANLVAASAANRLLGRGSASGAGDFQELTLGNSLALTSLSLDTIQDIRTSASPAFAGMTLNGNLTLGVQGSTSYQLKIPHTQPAGALPSAVYSISATSYQWTNDGTYYDNTGFYGWNAGMAQADEPSFGLALESKYSQGGTGVFGVEMHLVASFPDATSVRVLTNWTDRAAPHLAMTVLAGQFDFATSSTAGAQQTNMRIYEDGSVTHFRGGRFKIQNYANGASNSGKGEFAFISSDSSPYLAWYKTGAMKASIEIDLSAGHIFAKVGRVTGGTFYVWEGALGVYQSSASATGIQSKTGGGHQLVFTDTNNVVKFTVAYNGDLIQSGYHELAEMTAPAAATANSARIYAVDNGGKTQLMVRFPTGVAQQLAIEA